MTRRGGKAHLDDLITLAGSELRGKLGVAPTPAAEEVAVRAELPSNVEAARFYSEGLQKLRNFEPLAARDLLLEGGGCGPATCHVLCLPGRSLEGAGLRSESGCGGTEGG